MSVCACARGMCGIVVAVVWEIWLQQFVFFCFPCFSVPAARRGARLLILLMGVLCAWARESLCLEVFEYACQE